ncbi:hypothetical protein PG993_008038 [Apiospora rasikravindrae]|uniref:Uncharacterized protein n=1 Tax=Apiospora rasikravindrae TaxID=990691 RepID=A0ABR1SZ72_9PEZI
MAVWAGAAAGIFFRRQLDTAGLPHCPVQPTKPSKQDSEGGGDKRPSPIKRWTRKLKRRSESRSASTEERETLVERIEKLAEENGQLVEKNKTLQKANQNLLRQLEDKDKSPQGPQDPQDPPKDTEKDPEKDQDNSSEKTNLFGPNPKNLSPNQVTELYRKASQKRRGIMKWEREGLRKKMDETWETHLKDIQHFDATHPKGRGAQYQTFLERRRELQQRGRDEYEG